MRLSDIEQINREMVRAIVGLQSEELDALVEAAYKVPSPQELSQKLYGGLTGLDAAMQRVVAGAGIAIAQTIMSRHRSFGPEEIKKLLRVRKAFHPQMVAAAGNLANELEDSKARGAIPHLRRIASTRPGQEQKLVTSLARFFAKTRGKLRPQDFDDSNVARAMLPMAQISWMMLPESEQSDTMTYRDSFNFIEEAFKRMAKFEAIPTQLKTIFRKVAKTKVEGFDPYDFSTGFAEAGAWDEFTPEQKQEVQKRAVQLREKEESVFKIEDIEERRQAYRRVARERTELQNQAGVSIDIIERGDVPSLDSVLKSEKKQNKDAITEYVTEKYIKGLLDGAKRYPEQQKQWGGKRTLNKVITRLRKAKTLSTAALVIEDAVNRKELAQYHIEGFGTLAQQADGNLAVKEGIAIAPLDYEPVDEETFLERHGVGRVQFAPEYDEKQKREVLGRVSRALSDLETVYGSKVAARHAKRLDFIFESGSGTGGGAMASYFGWDNRNSWQPRVRFGEDFDNLLAHELSHYLDDLIAFEIEKKSKGSDMPEFQYGDVAHGHGDIFGSTGVELEYAAKKFSAPPTPPSEREKGRFYWVDMVREQAPELIEWVQAVNDSPDHERWKDLVPGAYDMVMDKAITDVMGDIPWKEKDKIREIPYKSDLPPGVAERADELYAQMFGGDTRKLTYKHSVVEVWARMCEQYVYTKLSRDGIANPWLTQMSYDASGVGKEVFMEQDRFDEVMVPIYDRLFERLKKKGMLGEGVMFISLSSLSRMLQESLA